MGLSGGTEYGLGPRTAWLVYDCARPLVGRTQTSEPAPREPKEKRRRVSVMQCPSCASRRSDIVRTVESSFQSVARRPEFRELRERNVDLIIGRISEPFAPDDLNVEALYEEESFQKQHLDVPRERVASLSMHLRCHLVANAGFVTIMPGSMFRFNADRWGLKALPIDLGIRSRNVSIITLKYRTLSPVVELFIEHARVVSKIMHQS
jgi:hypothetical protein